MSLCRNIANEEDGKSLSFRILLIRQQLQPSQSIAPQDNGLILLIMLQ